MAKATLKDTIFKGLFAAASPETINQVTNEAILLKALEVGADGQMAGNLFDADRVIDQNIGASGDRRLAKEEIKVGPPQSASGHGAARMISQYSQPDPQQDIVVNYEDLSKQLGDLRAAMKGMAETFTAILTKASESESEKEDTKGDDEKNVKIDIADEIEEEDEGEDQDNQASKSMSGPAKAALTFIKAAEELDRRAQVARKAKDMAKAKTLKGKVGQTLSKALVLIKSAPDRSEAAVKSLVGDIHAFALIKGFSDLAEMAAKAESEDDDAKKMEIGKAGASDDGGCTNQEKWPSAAGESGMGKSNVGSKAEMEGKLEAVLKGYAIQQGTISSILDAMAGKSNSELPTLDLGLAAKSAVGSKDPAALFKSNNLEAWETVKLDQISAAIDSGEFKITDEFACQSILSTAAAVRHGAIPQEVLTARVQAASENVRAMFSEVLAA